jgi:hypothetical protein
MYEFGTDLLAEIEAAEAAVEPWMTEVGPLPTGLSVEAAEPLAAAAGCAAALHVTVDHYFTSPLRRLMAYAGGAWRYRNVTATEEAGLAQVAMAADQIVVCWDTGNQLTLMRCVKTF